MENCYRKNITLGLQVEIVQKKHQRTNILTRGIVHRVLTSKNYHSRGIKVLLNSGEVGRVQRIVVD